MRAFSRKITFLAFFPKTEKNGQKKRTRVKKTPKWGFFLHFEKTKKTSNGSVTILQTK
jgi:hypothetical protein